MLVRVAPEVRARLEREAKQTGRSLSAVTEYYIAYASKAVTPADKPTRALCYFIERMTIYARGLRTSDTEDAEHGAYGFNWRADPFDFAVLKSALTQLLDRWAPKGEIGSSPYPGYATPEEAARTLVALVNVPADDLFSYAEGAKKLTGSVYYGQAQAWRDLKLGEDK